VGSACQHFRFVGCLIELDTSINEGIFVGRYLVQSKNYKIGCARSFDFYNQKDGGKNVPTTKNRLQQTTSQAHQGEGKRKGGNYLSKNCTAKSTC